MLQDVPERDHSSHAIETAYVNALKFVFEGSVDIDDRPVKVWTKVRVWIKQELTIGDMHSECDLQTQTTSG